MLPKANVRGVSWTLLDQGVVSVGAFLVNILLARQLEAAEYGTFALLFSVMLALQVFNGSLLFYPLSIRGAVARGRERAALLGRGMILVAGLCVPLGVAMAGAVLLLGRPDLLAPALAWFFLWQAQEALRRALFAEMRHRDAFVGDAVSYIGQVAIVAALIGADALTLPNALYGMALTKAVAALIQARQVEIELRGVRGLRHTVEDFWTIGRWSLLNNLISMLRVQIFPWALAAAYGPAAAAAFQAVINLVNLANPVVIGLCNIIPQAAAQGRTEQGNAHAWRATRGMMALGAGPLAIYFACAFAVPGPMLWLFYGAGSPYLDLALALQILTLAAIANYPADMICSYLHGIDGSGLALLVNAAGAAATVVLGFPLTTAFGVVGSCAALAIASGLRSAAACYVLARVTADDPVCRA